MCVMCDGVSPAELLAQYHGLIERYGFTMVGVEPNADHPPWLYTIGLAEFGHAELALVGLPLAGAYSLVEGVAEIIMQGRDLRDGDTIEVRDVDDRGLPTDLHLQQVDEAVLRDGDMFTQWHNYYGWRSWVGETVPELSALELILCGVQPGVTSLPAVQPDRATRRGRHRDRSRSGYRPLSA